MGLRTLRSAVRPITTPYVPPKTSVWMQSPDSVLDSALLRDQAHSGPLPAAASPAAPPSTAPAPAAPPCAAPAAAASPAPPAAGDVDPLLCASLASISSSRSAERAPDALFLDDVFCSHDAGALLLNHDLDAPPASDARQPADQPPCGSAPTGPPAHPLASAAAPLARGAPGGRYPRWRPHPAPASGSATQGLTPSAAPAGPAFMPSSEALQAHGSSYFGSVPEDEDLLFSDVLPAWMEAPTPALPTAPAPAAALLPTCSPPASAMPIRRAPVPTSRPIAIGGGARATAPSTLHPAPPSPCATDSYSSVCCFNLNTPVPTTAPTQPPTNHPSTPLTPAPPPASTSHNPYTARPAGMLSLTFSRPPATTAATPTAAATSPRQAPAASTAAPAVSAPIPIPRPTVRRELPRLAAFRLGPDWAHSPSTPDTPSHAAARSQPPSARRTPSPQALAEIARCRRDFNAAIRASPTLVPAPPAPRNTPRAAARRPGTHPSTSSEAAALASALAAAAAASEAAVAAKRAAARLMATHPALPPPLSSAAALLSGSPAAERRSGTPAAASLAAAAAPSSVAATSCSRGSGGAHHATPPAHAAATGTHTGRPAVRRAPPMPAPAVRTATADALAAPSAAPAAQGSGPDSVQAAAPTGAHGAGAPPPRERSRRMRARRLCATPEDDFEFFFCEHADWDLA